MSPVQPRVREAAAQDAAALGVLVGGVYLGEGWSPESARDRLASGEWVMRQGTALVAEVGGTIAGAVVLVLPGDPGRQIATATEAEFRLLAVSPASRGSGAGEALVREVIARARTAGFDGVVLSTQEGMAAAQRLYLRLRFERQSERDWARPSARMLVYRLALSGRAGRT